ncbi:MAG: hypothetical protein U0359_04370 [Byssovorax sp.]
MKKIFALLLLGCSAAMAIPASASSPTAAPQDSAPQPVPLDNHCCAACTDAGGTCQPGPGIECLCRHLIQ